MMLESFRNISKQRVCCTVILSLLVSVSTLIAVLTYRNVPHHISTCELLGSNLCRFVSIPPPPALPQRFWPNKSDDELAEYALSMELKNKKGAAALGAGKIAFLFLTANALPFELVWERFFEGHEGRYSIYVHASDSLTKNITWKTDLFRTRLIRSQKVSWGNINMIDAERRLLINALLDPDNAYFSLISDSCIPLHSFNYIYNHLINYTTGSFVDCFDDPGPHGRGRYMEYMLPHIERFEWRKGAQWFAVNRQHAMLIAADHVYYRKFKLFCKPGDNNRNCYPDEHYVQTFLHIMDPGGISNWTVTHVDWSEGKWHPKSYRKHDITAAKLHEIQMIDEYVHRTSNKGIAIAIPCLWNGEKRPCFLFARKFLPETADILLKILPSITWKFNYQSQ